MTVMQYLPWFAIALLLLLRFKYQKSVQPLAFAGGVIGYHVFLAASLLLGPTVEDYTHSQAFEPTAWRRNDQSNVMWPARLSMVDDLLATHPLVGISRDSLQHLLGPSDSMTYWKEWDFVYWLGPERGLIRLDSEWLVLRLGPDGHVREYKIVRD